MSTYRLELPISVKKAAEEWPQLFLEYEDVLSRPEQRLATRMSEEDVAGFLAAFASAAEPVDVHFLWASADGPREISAAPHNVASNVSSTGSGGGAMSVGTTQEQPHMRDLA